MALRTIHLRPGNHVPAYLSDLMLGRRALPGQARGIIYRALVRAASGGYPCPSHQVLNELVGYSSTSASPYQVRQLEEAGLILVERFQRSRVVTIVATGKSTAASRERLPHWRARSIHNASATVAMD